MPSSSISKLTSAERHAIRSRNWRAANPERAREITEKWQKANPGYQLRHRARKYGLTVEACNAARAAIICPACGRDVTGKGLYLHHDHDTGQFIAFICQWCNVMLGLNGDDPDLTAKRAASLAAYLKEN